MADVDDRSASPELYPPIGDDRALRLRDPRTPITITDLAADPGTAVEIVKARGLILDTARTMAIRLTSPPDWILFRAPDGAVTGYLQDAGCDRVRDIWGIDVRNVSKPEKLVAADGKSFTYIVIGDGRSRLSAQTVEGKEGGRSSTDDFCKGKTGADLELLVRKAARANLDGNITRELAGLMAVPVADLAAAWQGTAKSTNDCHKGRGFGTADERLGGARAGDPDVPPPTCPHCPPVNGQPVRLKYRPAKDNRAAFFGCPNFEKHADKRVFVDAADWVAKQTKAPAAATPPADREPGSDG